MSVPHLRRTMRLTDVALFFLLACTNLQWVATAAAAGPSSLTIWVAGGLAMFVPLSVVVVYLSSHYPDEGGLYVWSKRAFGPFAGFITGWTYWCTNLPYFPALLYFMAGNGLFIVGGGAAASGGGSPLYFILMSVLGFTFATVINVLGMDVGKWLNNVGAVSRWIVTLLLIALGAIVLWRFGAATPITLHAVKPGFALKDLIFWSVIAFAWTGPESVPFMAGEVEDPRRSIPRGLAIAAPGVAIVYVLGTAAILIVLNSAHVSGLYGVMQAITQASNRMGWGALAPLAAVLVTISCLGSTGAWLGAVARIPFVAGIDRFLPPAFGRVHPRWGSPAVALITQSAIAMVFVLLGQGGTTVKGAYDVLVSATVLITMVPFLFVFASAMRLRGDPAPNRVRIPGGRATVFACALVGMLTTLTALVLAVFPAEDEPNKPLAVAKILGLTALMIGSGVAVYAAGRRRANAQQAAAPAQASL